MAKIKKIQSGAKSSFVWMGTCDDGEDCQDFDLTSYADGESNAGIISSVFQMGDNNVAGVWKSDQPDFVNDLNDGSTDNNKMLCGKNYFIKLHPATSGADETEIEIPGAIFDYKGQAGKGKVFDKDSTRPQFLGDVSNLPSCIAKGEFRNLITKAEDGTNYAGDQTITPDKDGIYVKGDGTVHRIFAGKPFNIPAGSELFKGNFGSIDTDGDGTPDIHDTEPSVSDRETYTGGSSSGGQIFSEDVPLDSFKINGTSQNWTDLEFKWDGISKYKPVDSNFDDWHIALDNGVWKTYYIFNGSVTEGDQITDDADLSKGSPFIPYRVKSDFPAANGNFGSFNSSYYTITNSSGGSLPGTSSPKNATFSGSQINSSYKNLAQYNATPASGYVFDRWTVDSSGDGIPGGIFDDPFDPATNFRPYGATHNDNYVIIANFRLTSDSRIHDLVRPTIAIPSSFVISGGTVDNNAQGTYTLVGDYYTNNNSSSEYRISYDSTDECWKSYVVNPINGNLVYYEGVTAPGQKFLFEVVGNFDGRYQDGNFSEGRSYTVSPSISPNNFLSIWQAGDTISSDVIWPNTIIGPNSTIQSYQLSDPAPTSNNPEFNWRPEDISPNAISTGSVTSPAYSSIDPKIYGPLVYPVPITDRSQLTKERSELTQLDGAPGVPKAYAGSTLVPPFGITKIFVSGSQLRGGNFGGGGGPFYFNPTRADFNSSTQKIWYCNPSSCQEKVSFESKTIPYWELRMDDAVDTNPPLAAIKITKSGDIRDIETGTVHGYGTSYTASSGTVVTSLSFVYSNAAIT